MTSSAVMHAAMLPLPRVLSNNQSTEAAARRRSVDLDFCNDPGSSSSGGSSCQTEAAAQAATLQHRSARVLTSNSEEVPIIRICTGDFSGGPNKDVFRFNGQLSSPRGRAVRVPFAAGAAWMLAKAYTVHSMPTELPGEAAWMPLAGSDFQLGSAAGFMFASGLVLDEVPFDPELPFLFDGEEVGNCGDRWASRSSL